MSFEDQWHINLAWKAGGSDGTVRVEIAGDVSLHDAIDRALSVPEAQMVIGAGYATALHVHLPKNARKALKP